jgi:SAM-dependent methyltransferase
MSERGEIDEIAYTYGYCDELNPLRVKLPLLRQGLAFPEIRAACDLGFGFGVSVNIHAAGSVTQWYGTDFNASHADFARELAASAGSRAALFAERFSDFCRRDDLPDFDFIGMHGIWSWVSEENRGVIVDFLSRKLRPGGVLYLSYNTHPGWTPMLPVRDLMYRHFQADAPVPGEGCAPGEERVQARVKAAVDFAQAVFATQPGYAVVHPHLAERVRALSSEPSGYLAHEYFNRDWNPTTFSQAASSLGAAGLAYAGSAHYREHSDELNLSPAQRALLAGMADTGLRETTRDFCTNQSLRRDYWIKEPRSLGEAGQQAALRAHRVVLALPRASVVLKVRGTLGEVALPEAVYGPILDALNRHRPETLRHIEECMQGRGIPLARIVESVMLLVSMGVLLNAQDEMQVEAARPGAARLNAAICERARHRDELQFLVSPVSGSGIRVPRVAQLFLLARMRDMHQPEQWAGFASAVLPASPPRSELMSQATRFAQIHLPILQALGVA